MAGAVSASADPAASAETPDVVLVQHDAIRHPSTEVESAVGIAPTNLAPPVDTTEDSTRVHSDAVNDADVEVVIHIAASAAALEVPPSQSANLERTYVQHESSNTVAEQPVCQAIAVQDRAMSTAHTLVTHSVGEVRYSYASNVAQAGRRGVFVTWQLYHSPFFRHTLLNCAFKQG